jgi:alpha-ketoglutarate-dependent taurine dioxygenase
MRGGTIIPENLEQALASVPVFPATPSEMHVTFAAGATDLADVTAEVISQFYATGFAVIQFESGVDSDAVVREVQARLSLGEPYVPPMYRSRTNWADNAITSLTTPAAPGPDRHPSFHRNTAQNLHCDGTLQQIGEVPTTLLYCVRAAREGGESTLFNSVGAFAALYEKDRGAALAFLDAASLKRTANIGSNRDSVTGPVVGVDPSGQLISRYSVSSTDSWGTIQASEDLDRAVAFFEALADVGSGFYLTFTLADDQCLIFANDRIAHGRNTWIDDPEAPRHMKRALFLKRPTEATR